MQCSHAVAEASAAFLAALPAVELASEAVVDAAVAAVLTHHRATQALCTSVLRVLHAIAQRKHQHSIPAAAWRALTGKPAWSAAMLSLRHVEAHAGSVEMGLHLLELVAQGRTVNPRLLAQVSAAETITRVLQLHESSTAVSAAACRCIAAIANADSGNPPELATAATAMVHAMRRHESMGGTIAASFDAARSLATATAAHKLMSTAGVVAAIVAGIKRHAARSDTSQLGLQALLLLENGASDASTRADMHSTVLTAVRSHEGDRAIVEAGLLLLASTATNAVTKSIMVSDDRARLFSSPPDPRASRVVTAALARHGNSPAIARAAFQLISNTFDPEQELPWEGRWRMSGLVAAMTTAMQQHASDADLLLLALHAVERFASLYGWGNRWMINEAAQSAGLPAAITAAATLHGRNQVVAREAARVQRLLQ